MFTERTILERLARPRSQGQRTIVRNPEEAVRSILRNLQKLLNARVGYARAQMDLGMPAPSDIIRADAEGVHSILQTLRRCIEKYEPRLASVEIAHVESEDDVLTLRFQITARILTSPGGQSISFDTVMDPTGHFRVEE